MKTTKVVANLGFLGGFVLTACGAGKAVRPGDPTYAGAVGAAGPAAVCHDVNAEGDPLIVDWKPEDRADLEVALKKGVAVVHYDCQTIKLLPDCTVQGAYSYVGVTEKQQLLNIANADEAKANLPLNGGSIGGGISTGSELDIALAIVGKKSTTSTDVARAELKGKCDGATHFVRSATLGAFAMTTGTVGEIKVAADLFGVGASAGSSSKKSVTNKDGDSTACDKADPDGPKPPSQCGALLRLQLVAVGGANGAHAKASLGMSCPSGLVAMNGVCAAPKDDRVKRCEGGALDMCESLCDGNDIDACVFWSGILLKKIEAEQSKSYVPSAVKGLGKACDAGRAESCAFLGNLFWDGFGVPKDVNKGRDLNVRACKAGSGAGCASIGNAFITGDGLPLDKPAGLKLLVRACGLGSGKACVIAGQALSGDFGHELPTDLPAALDFFVRGCDAHESAGCANAGMVLDRGAGAPPNHAAALDFFQRGCVLGDAKACKVVKSAGGRR